ncbi:MAG TPA: NAD-dependent epimerase/dehydratase family protein [Planctomycetota bacterium]|nr:NAD-dependent epimerase/dehydratase family protein [Planctomycetota bacterium]
MSRQVLVTGGAGFIGSHVADALLARGDQVVVVDDFSSGRRQNVPARARLVEGDLSEPGVAARAVAGCDAVVHCAALPSVVRSVEDPVASNRSNLESSTRLLLACRDAKVGRLVYSSSSAVYGGTVEGPADEGAREAPLSPYGMNKLAAEHLFRMAPALYGVDCVCLRYFNVYGPRQDPSSPYSGVISIFITRALAGQPPEIHGDGSQSRDFTYVGDVAAANLAALDVPAGAGAVVNVGCGESTELLALWHAVAEACGRPGLPAQHGPPRAGDIQHSLAATGRARELLGFRARTSLGVGLASTVAWYRAALSVRT